MRSRSAVRPAERTDINAIENFLARHIKIHRHLDWLSPVEWIGHPVFLLLERKNQLEALLACTAEINGVYWIRLFACISGRMLPDAFGQLFPAALETIRQHEPADFQIACIASQNWLGSLLKKQGWKKTQQVIQLKWNPLQDAVLSNPASDDTTIRLISRVDTPAVAGIDQASFDPLWQHNELSIRRALDQSVYATICEVDGQAAGYQISTAQPTRAHIARLAVLPQFQRRHLGLALVKDTIRHFNQSWVRDITVNTQMDNSRSLNLYHQLGFRMTPEKLDIFSYSS
jgi:ribosomal protein S18 acetylase RimI-like enzyme